MDVIPSLVRDLKGRVIQCFLSLPKRGLEIGGVLYGHIGPEGIHIESFEEVPCEHRYGPSYTLSEADRTRLEKLLTQRSGEGWPPIIGLFRSFARREPEILPVDEDFVREHFPQGSFVFLELQPVSAEMCLATFRFFRDGVLLPETDDEPVPFELDQLSAAGIHVPEAPPPPPSAPPPPRDPEPMPVQQPLAPIPITRGSKAPTTELPRLFRDPEPPPRNRSWKLPVLVGLLLLAATAAGYGLWRPARTPQWIDLHLEAHPAGQQLEVTWDGKGAAAAGTTQAVLRVTEGGVDRKVDLTSTQARSGKQLIVTGPGEVALRLILYRQGAAIAGDSLRISGAIVPPPPPPASATPPPPAGPVVAAVTASTVHQVQPTIPPGIRSRLKGPLAVAVKVRVDEHGRVVRANAEGKGTTSVERYLAGQAEKAARQWRFSPVKSKAGAPMAFHTTVYFSFTP